MERIVSTNARTFELLIGIWGRGFSHSPSTLPAGCNEYNISNTCAKPIVYSYYDCAGNLVSGQILGSNSSVTICNNNDYGYISFASGDESCATVTFIGACTTYYYYEASPYDSSCNSTFGLSVVIRSPFQISIGEWVCADDGGTGNRYQIETVVSGPSYDYDLTGTPEASCFSLSC